MARGGHFICLCVLNPPQNVLNAVLVFLPSLKFLGPFRVLHLVWKVREGPLESSDGATKYLFLALQTPLKLRDGIIHIAIYVGEAIWGV